MAAKSESPTTAIRACGFGGAGARGFAASGVGSAAFGGVGRQRSRDRDRAGLSPLDSSSATCPPCLRMSRSFFAKLWRLVSMNGCGVRVPVATAATDCVTGKPVRTFIVSTMGWEG